eukprot:4006309-Pleurochrysis_carterae.AAC.3
MPESKQKQLAIAADDACTMSAASISSSMADSAAQLAVRTTRWTGIDRRLAAGLKITEHTLIAMASPDHAVGSDAVAMPG